MKIRFLKDHGGVLAAIAGIMAIAIATVYILATFWTFWDKNLEIMVALIIGLAPSGVLLYSQNKKEKRERHNWLLQKREPVLFELIAMYTWAFHGLRSSAIKNASMKQQKAKEFSKKVQAIQPRLLVWAPKSVFRILSDMETAFQSGSSAQDPIEATAETIRFLERFFRTVRKELDHDDSLMKPGEVVGTILLSPDKENALEICKDEKYD